jgi:hypothetical protein
MDRLRRSRRSSRRSCRRSRKSLLNSLLSRRISRLSARISGGRSPLRRSRFNSLASDRSSFLSLRISLLSCLISRLSLWISRRPDDCAKTVPAPNKTMLPRMTPKIAFLMFMCFSFCSLKHAMDPQSSELSKNNIFRNRTGTFSWDPVFTIQAVQRVICSRNQEWIPHGIGAVRSG